MVANPKEELHQLVERLSDDEAQRLSSILRSASATSTWPGPRPLTEADIVLVEPILPDNETADEMIAAV